MGISRWSQVQDLSITEWLSVWLGISLGCTRVPLVEVDSSISAALHVSLPAIFNHSFLSFFTFLSQLSLTFFFFKPFC